MSRRLLHEREQAATRRSNRRRPDAAPPSGGASAGSEAASASGGAGEAAPDAQPVFVALLTVCTSAVGATNAFTGAFQFEPFWVDLGLAAAALGVAIYLLASLISRASPGGRRLRFDPFRIGGALVLLAVFALTIAAPFRNALEGDWTVCGAFVSDCEKNACVRLLDDKGRKAIDECVSLDDSGYLPVHAEAWWRYRPAKASLVCGSVEMQAIPLSEAMLRNPKCSGVEEFR